MDDVSKLKFYSYGLVSKDKERDSLIVKVMLTEIRFTSQERVKDAERVEAIEYKITRGVDYVTQAIGNSIPATWINFNSNRITAPDVKENDLVLIWRLGDTDCYFWQDRNVANVKRLETVVWAFNADPSNPTKNDLSNAYMLMVSSHDKHITLKTSQSNGEFCKFGVQINTGDGIITIEDNIENSFWFDSKNTDIGFKNSKNTLVQMIKEAIKFKANASIALNSKSISLVSKDISLSADDITLDAKKSGSLKGKWKVDELMAEKFSHGGPPCC